MSENIEDAVITLPQSKIRSYLVLTKFRLSFLIVFSSLMTYFLGLKTEVNVITVCVFALSGFLITVAANITNQIIEINLDKLMKRTQNRPLPTGVLSINEAATFGLVCLVIGSFLMFYFVGILPTLITLLSAFLYGFVYTPLKTKTPFAVLVGAIPGALPPLIGWVAATGSIGIEGWVLFGIQFIWQFPHFWAIAWVLDDDYKKAGFKLLPSGGGRDLKTAFQIMIYTLLLLPMGLLPAHLGISGLTSAVVATVCGSLFLMQTFNLMNQGTNKAAQKIMFGSFLYLPIVQIAYLLDKL